MNQIVMILYEYRSLIYHIFDKQIIQNSTHMLKPQTQEKLVRYFNEMDFKSQVKAEKLFKGIIITVAIISYLIAFFFQKFSICVYSILAAMVICYIVIVPGQHPWWRNPLPPFRKNIKKE